MPHAAHSLFGVRTHLNNPEEGEEDGLSVPKVSRDIENKRYLSRSISLLVLYCERAIPPTSTLHIVVFVCLQCAPHTQQLYCLLPHQQNIHNEQAYFIGLCCPITCYLWYVVCWLCVVFVLLFIVCLVVVCLVVWLFGCLVV